MTDATAEAARQLCEAGRALASYGLAHGTSGNLSMRVHGGYLASPTNASLGTLTPKTISMLDDGGAHVAGEDPTKEIPLHLAVYARRPAARAIVHVHSTYAVALSCLRDVDPDDVLEHLTPYPIMRVGRLLLTAYARPGSQMLANAVAARTTESPALLLANHGPMFAGDSLAAAVAGIVEIEEAAKLQLLLRVHDVRPLTSSEIADLGRP